MGRAIGQVRSGRKPRPGSMRVGAGRSQSPRPTPPEGVWSPAFILDRGADSDRGRRLSLAGMFSQGDISNFAFICRGEGVAPNP